MESRAKTTSVSSMASRARKRTVTMRRPSSRTKNLSWRRLTGWTRESHLIQRGRGFGLLGGGQHEADGGDEQDGGEDVADPLEVGEEAEAGGDEGSAHDDGAGDSPEENLGLVAGFDVEDAEEDKKDEEVVDGERLFDGVAGEILGRALAAHGVEDEEGESESGGDPEDGGGDGGGVDLCRALAAHVDELHPEKNEDEDVKTYPVADGGCAGHLLLMLQRGRGRMHGARRSLRRVRRTSAGGLTALQAQVCAACRSGRLRCRLARANDHGVNARKERWRAASRGSRRRRGCARLRLQDGRRRSRLRRSDRTPGW